MRLATCTKVRTNSVMRFNKRKTWHVRQLILGGVLVCALPLGAYGELSFEPSWELPTYQAVRQDVLRWIKESRFAPAQRTEARSLWPSVDLRDSDGTDLLQRVVDTFSIVDNRVKQLTKACDADLRGPILPDSIWLRDETVAEFVRNNLSLYYARWLAQRGLYDEVVLALEGLSPADVVDPAGLLFYRTIAFQQLVKPEQSRAALVQLLEHEDALPRRYQQVAQLLSRDLAGLKDESLDHIARRMNDVRRRLDFGRAGEQVQMVEKSVVESLDKLIEKLEDQQQQQQSSNSNAQQSSKPLQESQLPAMRAPMQVEQRDIGSESGWGDLPPKEREQALQQIGREFPGYYRDVIEQYFRELADESQASPEN